MEVPKSRWLIMEIPTKNGWFGGTPILGNLHITILETLHYLHTLILGYITKAALASETGGWPIPNFANCQVAMSVHRENNPYMQVTPDRYPVNIYIYIHIYIHTHIHTHIHIHVHVHVYVYVSAYAYAYACICVYIYMYMYMYIYIYI